MQPTEYTCPVCLTNDVFLFLEIAQMPVLCNVISESREEALRVPKGDLKLGFSPNCGHIYNLAFDAALLTYSQAYENSLHFSPRFQAFATTLADRLIEKYELRNKNVVELGCGKGDFLNMLCEKGPNRGIGFDPSYEPDLGEGYISERFTVIQDLYHEKYAYLQADLVACRHVLEHIEKPIPFIQTVRRAMGMRLNTAVYFEVPNVLFTLNDLAIWDLIYEHCSYYSPPSLSYLFSTTGFEVTSVTEVYEGQFLSVEAYPSSDVPGPVFQPTIESDIIGTSVRSFTERYLEKVNMWAGLLNDLARNGKRAVVWGAGSKGVTILNILKADRQIEYVVDINPRKEGKFIAGTGQEIVSPDRLRAYQPDVIIVMNPIYLEEIREMVSRMGLQSEIITA